MEEICKAKHAETTKGTRYLFADALLSLLEPATTVRWECIHFRLRFDMSHIIWVMAAKMLSLSVV